MKCNEQAIKDIFYTGSHAFRADKQLIVNVCFLLENNLLFIKKEKFALVGIYKNYINEIENGKISLIDIEGGTKCHLALKLIGRDYLENKGFKNIKFESEFESYRPDLITGDGKIIIECGNTNPDKIFHYFKNKDVKKVIVIPYPDVDEKDIYFYIFTPGNELNDFLIFKEKEELNKVRKYHR